MSHKDYEFDDDEIVDAETPSNDGYCDDDLLDDDLLDDDLLDDDLLDDDLLDDDDTEDDIPLEKPRSPYASKPPRSRSRCAKSGDTKTDAAYPVLLPPVCSQQSLSTGLAAAPSAKPPSAGPSSTQPPRQPASVPSVDNAFVSPPKTGAVSPQAPTVGMPKIQFVVPNASQGKVFSTRVRPVLPKDCPPLASLGELGLKIVGYQNSGIEISIDGLELVFAGTPTISGETPLKFSYIIPAIHDDRPKIEQSTEVSWFINPDPRSLWKKIDPASGLPYPKAHTDHARVSGPAVIIAGSVRGRSHAHEGTFRDDDFAIDYHQASGWYLVTVCDGAGSAKFSRRGAKIACDVIREEIQSYFAGSLSSADLEQAAEACLNGKSPELSDKISRLLYAPMGGTAMKAFKTIQAEADATEDAVLKDFSTTLVFTIAKHFTWGWFVGSFCIGDGGAGIYSKTQPVKILNTPDGGEFAGQTRFLTMPDIWSSGETVMARIKFDVCSEMTALLAMTDGVSDAKFETDNRFFDTEVWHDLWSDIANEVELSKSNTVASEQLVKWLDFWSSGNHDDRTLAILLP